MRPTADTATDPTGEARNGAAMHAARPASALAAADPMTTVTPAARVGGGRRRLVPAALVALALALGAAPSDAAPDPVKSSRKCRDAIAKSALKLATTAGQLTEACHAQRNKGKTAADCNDLVAADPKGKLAKAEAKAYAMIAKRCAAGEPVLANYPGRNAAAAVAPAIRAAIAANAAALQGLPNLAGDKAAAQCHAELGKSRSKIIAEILKGTLKCQKAADKRATAFGPVDPACVRDPVQAAPKTVKALGKKCAGLAGADVGSCTPLPACLIDVATATGRQLAAAIYAKPSACDDGFLDPGETCPLLEGAPDAPAIDAVVDLDLTSPVSPAAIEEAPDGTRLVRTRLEIAFVADATVAEINALITGLDGGIISAVEGVAAVVVGMPDPGTLTALDTIVAELEASPLVRFVRRATLDVPTLLPDNYDPPGEAPLERIDHHLAVGAAAAWNAKGALVAAARPRVVILDYFGDGPPNDALDAAGYVDASFATGAVDDHGYHVAGIITARFGAPLLEACAPASATATALRGCATGIFPATSDLRVVDYQDPAIPDSATANNRLIHTLKREPGDAVLNTSLGYECTASQPTCVSDTDAHEEALLWAEKIRAAALEDRVLHLTAAGNIEGGVPANPVASHGSQYSAAALLPLGPVPNLANVLVIENAAATPTEPFAPACLAASSFTGGDLAAIGTEVWSLTDADASAGNLSGTSMATPQVAGLAAYLWSIEPSLTAPELAQLLRDTAHAPTPQPGAHPACGAAAAAPVIDAWAAVLSLDQATFPSPATAPVRLAILDLFDDGTFDELDLEFFLIEYVENYVDGGNHGALSEPAARDYGRFDLNGDGFTGGGTRAPFDLDRVGSTRFGVASLGVVTSAGGGLARLFDERALTDLDILCYYAFSALYTGSAAARQTLVDPAWCNPVALETVFPAEMEAGSTTQLGIRVVVGRADGSRVGVAGAHVEVFPIGGTVDDPIGTTDGDGFFATQVTAATDAATIAIDVTIRAAPGGPPIAEATVGATIIAPDPVGTIVLEELFARARVWSSIDDADLDDLPTFTLTASHDADPNQEPFPCVGMKHVDMSVGTAPDGTVTIESEGTGAATGFNCQGGLGASHVDLQFRVVGAPVHYAFDPAPTIFVPSNVPGEGSALVILFAGPQPLVGGGGEPVACWCANECDGRCPAEAPPLAGTLPPGVYSILGLGRRSGAFDFTLRLAP